MGVMRRFVLVFGVAFALGCGVWAQSVGTRWERLNSTEGKFWSAKASFAQFASTQGVAGTANIELEFAVSREFEAFVGRAFLARKADPSFFTTPWTLDVKTTVSIANQQLISAYVETSLFEGGAHPNLTYTCINVGMKNGQPARLRLTDVLRPGQDSRKALDALLMTKLRERKASQVVDGDIESLPDELLENFIVTPSAMTFLFAPYAVGSYAEGSFLVKIPFEELAAILDPNGPLKPVLATPSGG